MNKGKRLLIAATCVFGTSIFSVSALAACTDPWVTSAVKQVTGRDARGSGNSGECNIKLYGNGHWSYYNDLVRKVRAASSSVSIARPVLAPPSLLVQPNTGLLKPNGSGIVSGGAGNLVGNRNGIVSGGAGNLVGNRNGIVSGGAGN